MTVRVSSLAPLLALLIVPGAEAKAWTAAEQVPAAAVPAEPNDESETPPAPSQEPPEDFAPEAKATITAPSYCKPCLYYSGDTDPMNAGTNALTNGISLLGGLNYVYTPFAVPTGHTWHVTGLISNEVNTVSGAQILDPAVVEWSIWSGMGAGVPGTLLSAGTASATAAPTERTINGDFAEYTIIVKLKPPIKLVAGTYFMNVLPQCTDASNAACHQQTFESNVEDASPSHQFGPANILDDSFFYSGGHSAGFLNANSQGTFDLFSFGIIGTSSKH